MFVMTIKNTLMSAKNISNTILSRLQCDQALEHKNNAKTPSRMPAAKE